MSKAAIGGRKPAVLALEPGAYWWCRCGRSKKQPFCDGSHSGTGFSPARLDITESKRYALCNCKRTARPPFCDGSHSKLD